MYVTIMKLILTIILGFFGITPKWCDCCGEMYQKEQMTYCVYDEGDEGDLCPICFDYWM